MGKQRREKRKRQIDRQRQQTDISINLHDDNSEIKSQSICAEGVTRHVKFIITVLLISIWIFTLYSNSLNGPFIFDDTNNIAMNKAVHLEEFSTEGISNIFFENSFKRRPVSYFSFALNYYFDGDRVIGYRVVNILIHLLVGLVLYLFTKVTLQTPFLVGVYKFPCEIAALTGIMFLVHPVAVQSVAYVVQRMASLSALFYLLSMFCYLKARLTEKRRAWFWFCGFIAALLAFGSKENAAMLPVFILLYEWYFFQNLKWREGDLWFKWLILGLIAVTAIVLAIWGGELIDWILGKYNKNTIDPDQQFTIQERLLTELRVIVYYLTLLAYPHPDRLNLDYDFGLSTSLLTPVTTLGSLCLLVSLIGLAIIIARRNRLLSFAILWFLGNLVIESTVIPLEIIYEHRTYLPFMMLFLAFAALLPQLIQNRKLYRGIVSVLIIIFSFWTYQRSTVWGDNLALWQDAVNKAPGKYRTHQNLASALMENKQFDQALIHFVRASEMEPRIPSTHLGRGQALAKLGRLQEAVNAFEEVIRLQPNHFRAHADLGAVLMREGRNLEAIDELSTGLKLDPDNASIHYNLGLALAEVNRAEESIVHFRQAIELDRNLVLAMRNLAVLLFKKGEIDESISLLRKAAQLLPQNAVIWSDLGMALLTAERKQEAIATLRKALKLNPGLTTARQRLVQAESLP
ncbi:MAG: tetratricopeptide repeat protein [Gammaproteobacteria bacterium]